MQVQPNRRPLFVSACWYFQAPRTWPILYQSAREVFEREQLLRGELTTVDEYLAFAQLTRELCTLLSCEFEDLETVCHWERDRAKPPEPDGGDPGGGGVKPPPKGPTGTGEAPEVEEESGTIHTHAQYVLAMMGRKLGCDVWIARNDRSKAWNEVGLGTLSIDRLPPLGAGPEAEAVVSLIDVLWLSKKRQVVAAFEIESTTSIYSGLLRMSDLTVLVPNLNFPCYIVAPQERLDKVRRELRRPTFQAIELHERCGFFSCEKLVQEAESIMRWAGDPGVIDRLAERVEDASAS